jgi:hypothetical protein
VPQLTLMPALRDLSPPHAAIGIFALRGQTCHFHEHDVVKIGCFLSSA